MKSERGPRTEWVNNLGMTNVREGSEQPMAHRLADCNDGVGCKLYAYAG